MLPDQTFTVFIPGHLESRSSHGQLGAPRIDAAVILGLLAQVTGGDMLACAEMSTSTAKGHQCPEGRAELFIDILEASDRSSINHGD